jgi:hypothetical protein
MKNMTPIQKAIEKIKDYRDSGSPDVDTCNTILLHLASMIQEEEETICDFATNFYFLEEYNDNPDLVKGINKLAKENFKDIFGNDTTQNKQ